MTRKNLSNYSKYQERYNSTKTSLSWIKRGLNEGIADDLSLITMERFLKNSKSDMGTDELYDLIESEDVSDLMMNRSLVASLVVGELVDLERGLLFKNYDGEIDQSSLELFKGTTLDKAYADAQAIAKKIQSTRQQEIFKGDLTWLLDKQTSNRAEDNESKLENKIASEVWSGWRVFLDYRHWKGNAAGCRG